MTELRSATGDPGPSPVATGTGTPQGRLRSVLAAAHGSLGYLRTAVSRLEWG
ncbi:MAG: hypothetical protein OXH85_06720 [Truepera sp.]|nr:hypothetical protein [Truepera sp.]